MVRPGAIGPLRGGRVPLRMGSFVGPARPNSMVGGCDRHVSLPPVCVGGHGRILLSLAPHSFSFVTRRHLDGVFNVLTSCHVGSDLIRATTVDFSLYISCGRVDFHGVVSRLHSRCRMLCGASIRLVAVHRCAPRVVRHLVNRHLICIRRHGHLATQFMIPARGWPLCVGASLVLPFLHSLTIGGGHG